MSGDGELDGVVERQNGEAEIQPGAPAQAHRRHAAELERHGRPTSDPSVPIEPEAAEPDTKVDPPETG